MSTCQRVAIATDNQQVAAHFGRCREYTIADVDPATARYCTAGLYRAPATSRTGCRACWPTIRSKWSLPAVWAHAHSNFSHDAASTALLEQVALLTRS